MTTQTYQIEAKLKASGATAFTSAFKNAENSLNKFNSTGSKLTSVGKDMQKVGATMTKAVTLPLLAIGTASLATATKFQSSMSEVKAISGATGEEMKTLENIARKMGATTKFSASEAADGLKYMALAGWDVNQMTAALPAVLNLAAASGEDLGRTSDIVTDALSAFGLEAKDAAKFSDLLASASSNSNTNVSMLGESFKYVAPVMGALGVTTDDTALALGLLANNGIKGGQAGTQLRNMMTSLISPTAEAAALMEEYGIEIVKNADGTINLKDTMDVLRLTLGGLEREQQAQIASTLFGSRTMAGALSIVNSSEESYEQLTEATTNYTGAAQIMAETMMDNLAGSFITLKSNLSESAISIGDTLIPMVRSAIEKKNEWVTAFNKLDDSTKDVIVKIGLYLAVLGPVISVTGKLIAVIGGAITKMSALAAGTAAVTFPFTAVAAAVAALVGSLVIYVRNVDNTKNNTRKLRKEIEKTEESFENLNEELKENQQLISVQVSRMKELAGTTNRTAGEQAELENIIKNLSAEYPDLINYIDGQTGAYRKGEAALDAYIGTGLEQEELILLDKRRNEVMLERAKTEELLLQAGEELSAAEERFARTGALSDRSRVTSAKNAYNDVKEIYDGQQSDLDDIGDKYEEVAVSIEGHEETITKSTAENAEARKDLKGDELKAYVEALDDMSLADDEFAQKQKENLENAQKQYDDYYQELESKTSDIYTKMGGLGDGAVEKMTLTAEEVKQNLAAQIADWNNWQTSLAEIQGRVPEVMVQELEKMGPAALPLLEEYNAMTDEELSETVSLFEEKHGLAKSMAVDEIEPLAQEILDILGISIDNVKKSSKPMENESKKFGKASVDGFASNKKDFISETDDMLDKARNAVTNKTGNMKSTSTSYGKAAVEGLASNKGDFIGTAGDLADSGVSATASRVIDMSEVGSSTGKAYTDGVGGQTELSRTVSSKLADASVASAGSTRVIQAWNKSGAYSVESYSRGVSSSTGTATKAGESVGLSSRSGASSISHCSTGSNAGGSFVSGIYSQRSAAYSAGYSIGLAANQGQKAALGIRSPSKVAEEDAINFGETFIKNLLKLRSKVFKAGELLSGSAVRGLEQPTSYNFDTALKSGFSPSGADNRERVSGGGIVQNITLQSPKHLTPAENARKIKQASRELVLEW